MSAITKLPIEEKTPANAREKVYYFIRKEKRVPVRSRTESDPNRSTAALRPFSSSPSVSEQTSPFSLFTSPTSFDIDYDVKESKDERLLEGLERGFKCDSFIRVKEGLIPVNSVILQNSGTFWLSFRKDIPLLESKTTVFSMVTWDTETVIDVIEALYTDSLDHIKEMNGAVFIRMFEVMAYMDINLVWKLILKTLMSSFKTIWEPPGANGARRSSLEINNLRNTGCVPAASGRGGSKGDFGPLLTEEGELDKHGGLELLFRILWITSESDLMIDHLATIARSVQNREKVLKSTLYVFCRTIFDKRDGFRVENTTDECLAYFCSFSSSTIANILTTCMNSCQDYDWNLVLSYVSLWVNADENGRINNINQLIGSICFDRVSTETSRKYYDNPQLFYDDPLMEGLVSKANAHIQKTYKACERTKGSGYSRFTPFTVCEPNEGDAESNEAGPPSLKRRRDSPRDPMPMRKSRSAEAPLCKPVHAGSEKTPLTPLTHPSQTTENTPTTDTGLLKPKHGPPPTDNINGYIKLAMTMIDMLRSTPVPAGNSSKNPNGSTKAKPVVCLNPNHKCKPTQHGPTMRSHHQARSQG